jgi:sirohydrochlorin ferrochelatase
MRLVTVAHGTRDAAGNRVAAEVTAAAERRLGMTAVASYVELCEPSFASVVQGSREPTVVVPLLLSTGYHLRHDLPEAVAAAPGRVVLGSRLGPDPLLAAAQAERLRAAGSVPGQPVVMVAAGSNDPLAAGDLAAAARLLAEAWGGPVSLATLSGPGVRPAELVTPEHAVSPYLLSPGYFARRTSSESGVSGQVADVIGTHPLVVDLVVAHTSALLEGGRRSA